MVTKSVFFDFSVLTRYTRRPSPLPYPPPRHPCSTRRRSGEKRHQPAPLAAHWHGVPGGDQVKKKKNRPGRNRDGSRLFVFQKLPKKANNEYCNVQQNCHNHTPSISLYTISRKCKAFCFNFFVILLCNIGHFPFQGACVNSGACDGLITRLVFRPYTRRCHIPRPAGLTERRAAVIF